MNLNKGISTPLSITIIIILVGVLIVGGIIAYQYYYGGLEENETNSNTIQKESNKFEIKENIDWQTYRNEQYGFEFKYPSELIVSFEGPNTAQQALNNGEEISGTMQPSHESIIFSDSYNELARVEIFHKYEKDIIKENYQAKGSLYLSGLCDTRWGFQLESMEMYQMGDIEMLAVEGKDKDDLLLNCYYSKNLEGELIVFSIHNYKINQFISDSTFFESKLLTEDQVLQKSKENIHWARLTKEGDNEDYPVALYQAITIPDSIFEVSFDYAFLTKTGVLDLTLNSALLAQLNTKDVTIGLPHSFKTIVKDGTVQYGLKDAIFQFSLLGPEGSKVIITNIAVTEINPFNPSPIINSIFPSSGPIGTIIELKGKDFTGFEGDLIAWIENSKGEKGILFAENQYTGNMETSTLIRTTIEEKLCTHNTSYSGLPCTSWLTIVSGTYTIYTEPWGKKSNSVEFIVTGN